MTPSSPTQRPTGLLLAISASFSVALIYIISKLLLGHADVATFIWLWFTSGNLWYAVACRLMNQWPRWEDIGRNGRTLLVVGALQSLSAYLYFSAISLAPPSLVAFYVLAEPVFDILLGMAILGERLNRREAIAGLVILAGAGCINYHHDAAMGRAMLLALAQCLLVALANTQARKAVRNMPPMAFAWVRSLLMWCSFSAVLLVKGDFDMPQGAQWLGYFVGGLIGPCLSVVLWYEALKRAELARATLFKNMTPLFVIALSIPIFGVLLTPLQYTGGAMMMAGAALFSWTALGGRKR